MKRKGAKMLGDPQNLNIEGFTFTRYTLYTHKHCSFNIDGLFSLPTKTNTLPKQVTKEKYLEVWI